MPISTSTVFTCDRDGVVSEPIVSPTAAAPMPPKDWGRLLADITQSAGQSANLKSVTGFLCPACMAAFQTFMGIDSPMFKP